MQCDEGHKPLSPLHPTVPIIRMGTQGCVPHWQVPEMHPDPSSHIHSGSDNSWCAGPFPASAFIHSGIRVSLFVLVKWAGRAGHPRHVYTALRRGLKLGLWTNNIKHSQEENVGIEGKITSQVWFLQSQSRKSKCPVIKGRVTCLINKKYETVNCLGQ